jgi:transposase-like protein
LLTSEGSGILPDVHADTTAQWGLTPGVGRLEVIDLQDQRSIFVNGHLVARYACNEKGTERVLATQLAEVLPIPDGQIASAFGLHPVTLSRFCSQARSGGAAALMPRKMGPKRPSKMTPKLQARCRDLREQGLSVRAIAERVSRGGHTLSHVTVAALFKAERTEAKQQPLAVEWEAAPEREPERPEPGTVTLAEPRATRYAGALMLYAGLARLDLWSAFGQLGAEAGPARRFGWRQTLATIILCFALRFRSIEDFKNARRADLGALIGEEEGPTVLSLRGKIKALAESVDPVAVSRELFRRYLTLEAVWEGLYYIDGHFCPYHGKQPTPRGWDSKRRLAVKGHTDVYIHDARGRALFFFSQPLNDSLARAIPNAVEEIRRAHGTGPFTLVFDRGGYSADAFRFLEEQGVGFITYLKGRKARRRHPPQLFRPGWFSFEGQRHCYKFFEKKTRVARTGLIRTIVFLGDDDQQIPLLTNLAPHSKAAKVIHCLRLRWRQENSFKYLSDHYAIDQIVQYGAEQETQDRLVSNPRRKALKEQARTLSQQIQALEAQLGRALNENDEGQRPTARGFKIAHGRLRREIIKQRQALTRIENRLQRTPGQISAEKVDKTRSLLREDRRLVVNALKIAACNAEQLLVRRFDEAYAQPKDAFSVFRALLHLPGHLSALGDDHVAVRLQRPDSEKIARALEALLAHINQDPPRMLGEGPRLRFTLEPLA